MATRRWLGGARLAAQVTSWLFGGVWLATEHVTVAVGTKSITVLTGSTAIATILANVQAAVAALTASLYPELAEATWTNDATHLIATGKTPGKPFLATVSTDSAAGTIGGVAAPNSSSTGTNTTPNGGPNDVSVAANWGGALPGNNDTMAIDADATDDLLYNLDFFAANTGLTINHLGSVRVGLPTINTDAVSYPEYRATSLVTAGGTVNLGGVSGSQALQGTGRFKHDAGAAQATWNVYLTAQGQDSGNLEAALLKGTHASNVLNVLGQAQVGYAVFGGEAAAFATLRAANGGYVRCGAGVSTMTTVQNDGGTIELNSAVGTLKHGDRNGTTTINGTGAVATISATNGTINYNTSGTLTNYTLYDALLDLSGDSRAVTFSNAGKVYGSGDVLDPLLRVTNLAVNYYSRNFKMTRSVVD